ncbi:MAG: hypothetical protein JNN04_08210 [Cyclobacteriaceae bacterium]|nr:hypothetical protein [Cyclobacteriaceae bacterium]
MRKVYVVFGILLLLQACSSGKAALSHGNYYEAVLESVNRLRSSPDNKKAKAVLQQGYPLAVDYIESNIKNGIASDDPRKWRNAVKGYEQINYMNDQIKTSLGAMKVISQPVTRYTELKEVRTKAAEESYSEGITSLMRNTREEAKRAYFDFKEANTYEPGYRESIEMMTQAEFNATLRVAYEEINASTINYGSIQPIINSLNRQFLSFRPVAQRDTVPPHQQLRVIFNGYREDGSARITSNNETVTKEIKTGEQKKGADGKMVDVMTKVTAKITYYKKTKSARSSSLLTITDVATQGVLQNETVEGRSSWQAEWATYTGDIRALSSSQQSLTKQKETFPNDRDLFNQAMRNLEANLERALKNFYSQY